MATAYAAETKAAVLAALLAGQSVHAVARSFGIGRTTIASWRDEAGISQPTPVGPQNQAEIGGLVVEHVRTALLALTAQARVATDPEWIAQQSAGDLAILFGVMSDKTHRILAALQPVGGGDDGPDPAEPRLLAP